ncbi:uncharacterized protein LOC117344186 [Pecten maximus]|uniref:uncharacterized protein LOC117344186 n=1 Tax=Pecten maximus TaxID=6579 RepID=UPI001458858A|nr:uncharacterized protein LOC117344186 [Pecten maximus]
MECSMESRDRYPECSSGITESMDRRYSPRITLPNSYEKVPGFLSAIVDPYPVPVIDYPQGNKTGLCSGKLTLFHEYSPFMNSYKIYHMKDTSLPEEEVVAPPVIRQPKCQAQRSFSKSLSKGKSRGEEDADKITCDIIKKHWCYYIMCLGLCFD